MAILEAMQSAAARLVGRRPAGFFTSTDAFEVEISDLVTETAVAIMKAHDWRRLTKLHSITGDGSTIGWPMPDDYDRMLLRTDMHSGTWETWRFTPARDLDQWLDVQTSLSTLDPGFWIVLEGQMQVYPAIPSAELAKFYYVSNYIADSKAGFSADTDVFLLDNRLLTLGLMWRWRSQKRMEYSEDLSNYEIALSEAIGRDKGSRALYTPRRTGYDVRTAYPGVMG